MKIELQKNIKKNAGYYLKHSVVAGIGFLLSPLSWWNDLFINVPVAYGFAYFLGMIFNGFVNVTKIFFIGLFIVGYWLTNILGFVMMEKGLVKIVKSEQKNISIKWQIIIGTGYSILAALFLYFGASDVFSLVKVLPEWVK